jgi:hypothetical protein
MKENLTRFRNSRISKIVLSLSILVAGFCWLGHSINVYRFALVGAIFEILWLPALAMLFVLPIASLILLIKEKVNIRSLYIYSFLIGIASILFILF